MAVETINEPKGFTDEELDLFKKLNIGTEGGLPLPSFIRPSEVVAAARPLAESIFGDWSVLKALIERHEQILHDRWKSMKKKKRRDMLLEAWPGMHPAHRPDVTAWRARENEESAARSWSEEEKAAFMWPYINLDDLAKTARPLWLMVSSRGRNTPDIFSDIDLDAIRLGKACLALRPRYLNKYSMLFTGRTAPDTYGQLYPWSELSDDEDDMKSHGMHPGEGIFILEIQARLYAFLRDMAQRIIGSALLAAPTSRQPLPKPLDQDTFGLPSDADFQDLATADFESAYRAPRPVDLQRLLDYTFGRLGEAEDHVWALREDPAYFASSLWEWRDHRREMVPTGGETHPIMRGPPLAFWTRVMEQSVRRALEQVETWHILYAKARLVASQMEKHAKGGVQAGRPLPKDLALSFYSLVNHLRNLESEPVGNLQVGAFASPPLRRYFRLKLPDGPDDDVDDLVLVSAPERAQESTTREVIWALEKLQDDDQRRLLGTQTLLGIVEQALAAQTDGAPNNPTSRDSVLTSWVAGQLSSLALYAACTGEVARFQPWASGFESAMRENETAEVLQMDFHMSMGRLRPLLQFGFRERIVALGLPEDGRFDGGDIRAADSALDAFWSKLKASMEKNNALTPRVGDLFHKLPTRDQVTKVKAGRSGKRVQVDKRSAKVFRAVFWDPRSEVAKSNVPAEVPWLDFVHAMHSAGFDVLKMYGSAWLFVPKAAILRGKSPSIFREPWTEANKIPLVSATWFGKRLARAYGWDKDTFETTTG